MKAIDVMNTPIVAASCKASAREVALYMLLGGFSGVPIVTADGALVGIVTELDLLRAVQEDKPLEDVNVSDIMTREVVTVNVDTPVVEIMKIFASERILRVPVMKGNKIVGVVSRPDLLRAAVEPYFIRVG